MKRSITKLQAKASFFLQGERPRISIDVVKDHVVLTEEDNGVVVTIPSRSPTGVTRTILIPWENVASLEYGLPL